MVRCTWLRCHMVWYGMQCSGFTWYGMERMPDHWPSLGSTATNEPTSAPQLSRISGVKLVSRSTPGYCTLECYTKVTIEQYHALCRITSIARIRVKHQAHCALHNSHQDCNFPLMGGWRVWQDRLKYEFVQIINRVYCVLSDHIG